MQPTVILVKSQRPRLRSVESSWTSSLYVLFCKEERETEKDGRLLRRGQLQGTINTSSPPEQLCTGEITSKQFPDGPQLGVLHLNQHGRVNALDLLSWCARERVGLTSQADAHEPRWTRFVIIEVTSWKLPSATRKPPTVLVFVFCFADRKGQFLRFYYIFILGVFTAT